MEELMLITVIVLVAFQDKNDHKTQYAPGMELQVEKERADDLIARKLAKLKETSKSKGESGTKGKGGKPVNGKKGKPDSNQESDTTIAPEAKSENEVNNEQDATAESKGTEE